MCMKRELSMQEVQQVSLAILKQVAEICEKLELKYALVYGTLIGAIRHKGFIPWDDDLDIMMPRNDYEKLLNYFKERGNVIGNLEVFNPDANPNYPYMITRISDNRYHIVTENEKDYGLGAFIDIYPYDGLGKTFEEAYEFGMKGDRLSSLCFCATREKYKWDPLAGFVKNVAKLPVFLISKIVGKSYFQKKLAQLAGQKDFDESQYVGCVVWLSGGKKDIFERKLFDELIKVPFEGEMFYVPKEYDKVLRHTYGDYMQLPPENERIGHHYYVVYEK